MIHNRGELILHNQCLALHQNSDQQTGFMYQIHFDKYIADLDPDLIVLLPMDMFATWNLYVPVKAGELQRLYQKIQDLHESDVVFSLITAIGSGDIPIEEYKKFETEYHSDNFEAITRVVSFIHAIPLLNDFYRNLGYDKYIMVKVYDENNNDLTEDLSFSSTSFNPISWHEADALILQNNLQFMKFGVDGIYNNQYLIDADYGGIFIKVPETDMYQYLTKNDYVDSIYFMNSFLITLASIDYTPKNQGTDKVMYFESFDVEDPEQFLCTMVFLPMDGIINAIESQDIAYPKNAIQFITEDASILLKWTTICELHDDISYSRACDVNYNGWMFKIFQLINEI